MKKKTFSLHTKKQHCDAFRSSGLRPSEYCKQSGISTSSLWRWQQLDSSGTMQFKRIEVEPPGALEVMQDLSARHVAHIVVKNCEVLLYSGASQQDVTTLIRAITEVCAC